MAPFRYQRILVVSVFLLVGLCGSAQNLLPNPSFENYDFCPATFNQIIPLPCTPWQCASTGTSDFFHECADPSSVGVPINYFGHEPAHTGVAYVGGYYRYAGFQYREYLQCQLISTLTAGQYYYFSMYVSLGDTTCAVDHMGAYFSVTPPTPNGFGPINVTPQVESALGYITEKNGWTLFEGCFIAEGGEAYITIGNFYDDSETIIDPACQGAPTSYYYVDDVLLLASAPPGELFLELGDPVVACTEYEINPDAGDVLYYWEDGSHLPTLTVTASGTYSLTITDGCNLGEDSIEVEIIGISDPVDIGPQAYTMCLGEVYSISLDPDAGEYEWSDGSSGAEIEITSPGLYSVTLNDDDCDFTEDEVLVTVIDPPAPFTLGDDTYLCSGDEIEYHFDPSLGDFEWSDGSNDPDHPISEPGVVSLTISNTCGEFVDEIEIEGISPPVVNFDPDPVVICEGEIYEIELDPDMGDFVWQDGSTNNFYSITEAGHYSVNVINECGTDNGQLDVIVSPQPILELGPDQVLCNAQLPITLTAGTASGQSYLWQDGSLGSTYQVTSAGSYQVTVTNLCTSVSDQVVIAIQNPTLNVVLPPDQSLCQGQSFVIRNTGDSGTYLWQDNSTADSLVVSAPGLYAVTVSTLCGVGSDSVVVNFIPPVAIPDLGPDFSLCPGESFVLAPPLNGVTYQWQDNSIADTLLVSTAGTFFVAATDGCTTAYDTVNVVVDNIPPQLNLPSQLSLCQGASITLDAGISGVNYLWNDGSQNASLDVTAPGMYALLVSNSCGSDKDTVNILDGGPAPLVSLGNDVSFCSGDVVTLTPTNSNVSTWLWSDGSTANTFTVNNSGLITVEVSNACGTNFDTINAVLLPATPPINLGLDTALCPGSTLLLTISTPSVSIEWSDGSTNPQLLISNPGTYFATITNSCGANTDTIDVDPLPPPPVLNLGIDQSLCPGEVITFDPGILNVTYLWQDGSTAPTFNATQAGTVSLTISNACGVASDAALISISTMGPDVNLGPDVLGCLGDVVTLTSDIAGVNYLWQDGSTLSSFDATASGKYYLQVSNNCGTDADTVVVDINGTPPATILGPDTTLCTGNNLILKSTAGTGTLLNWQDGSSASTFTVNSSGTYSLFESNHCGDHRDTIRVDFLDAPIAFVLGPDTTLCPGESVLLTVPQTGLNIKWQDGSTGTTLIADKAQTYSLELSNQCGLATDALTLTYDNNVPLIQLGDDLTWCPGATFMLDAAQTFPAAYTWNTGSTAPSIQIVNPGTYAVTVSALCANDQDNVIVLQDNDCFPVSIFVPNVFSPNDDNINDVFTLNTNAEVQISKLHGSIFDRWGSLVFDTEAIPMVWNGRFNNKLMQPGVYVYSIILDYSVNGLERHEVLKGDVTLVR